MKPLLISWLLFSCTSAAFCQHRADNWYFGIHAGLQFVTGAPVVLSDGQLQTLEGCAAISDRNGNLLFYSNGEMIWNRQHQPMPGGSFLMGNTSSSQSALIIPQPGNDSIYFVFTTMSVELQLTGCYYSVVNMNANNGLGAVTSLNNLLMAPNCEKLSAVFHCNKKDVWVLSRKFNSDQYYCWLVTASGISAPVISATGNYIGSSPSYGINAAISQLKISPDGKKIAAAHAEHEYIELGDFDNATGVVSNTIKLYTRSLFAVLPYRYCKAYSVEFSPDSKLLYSTLLHSLVYPNEMSMICQVSIANWDSAAIVNSHYFVDSTALPIGALQLGPDRKLYFGRRVSYTLSRINDPMVPGSGCNFQEGFTSLAPGRSMLGLPGFNQSFFDTAYAEYDFTADNNCSSLSAQFNINTIVSLDSVRWEFADPGSGTANSSVAFNPVHLFSSSGNYSVRLLLFRSSSCGIIRDTIRKLLHVGIMDMYIGSDTSICEKDTLLLTASLDPADHYLWNTGATTRSIKASQQGIYWCDADKDGCIYRDSLLLTARPLPLVDLGADTTICENNSLSLNAGNPNSTYTWQDGTTLSGYLVSAKGRYSVTVTTNGCIKKDTIDVNYQLKPKFSFGEDKYICNGMSYLLDPGITGVNYLWQDGSTRPAFLVTGPGLYELSAGNYCGSTRRQVKIFAGGCKLYLPNAFTPNDDGLNDVFKAGMGENVIAFDLRLYNRYGAMVFHSKQKTKGWDGKYKGIPQNQGAYTWVVDYKIAGDDSTQHMKGTVLLIR